MTYEFFKRTITADDLLKLTVKLMLSSLLLVVFQKVLLQVAIPNTHSSFIGCQYSSKYSSNCLGASR